MISVVASLFIVGLLIHDQSFFMSRFPFVVFVLQSFDTNCNRDGKRYDGQDVLYELQVFWLHHPLERMAKPKETNRDRCRYRLAVVLVYHRRVC